MGNKYLDCLIHQFGRAVGKKLDNMDYNVFLEQFSSWVKERAAISRKYTKLLKEMGINFDNMSCVEIGKGRYDSLANHSKHLSLITLYRQSLSLLANNRTIIDGSFKVEKNGLITMSYYDQTETLEDAFSLYMTQNPYNFELIENWENIPNDKRDIVIGMFGNTFDRDYVKKMKVLEEIRKNSPAEIIMDGSRIKDQYCYAISSIRTR